MAIVAFFFAKNGPERTGDAARFPVLYINVIEEMDIVRKIIRAYLYNPMPEKVQRQFRSWCLREEGSHEKTEALREEWERLDPAAVLPTDEEAYRGKLARLHGEMRPPLRLRTIPLSRRAAAVAAAVVVLAMSVEFFVVRHLTADSTTVLVTAENSKGRFTLPDGSVVWLNADSRLAYSNRFVDSEKREVRLEGEAFFDVRRDTLRPFEVEMGKLRVKVLGTRFTASHMPAFNTEEVTLLSGKVEVSGYRTDQSVVLTPDQSCSYDAGSGAVAVRNVAASNYCSWTGNSIIFDNMTLADIAVNLEHWYNIRFRIDERIDTSIRISFTLRPETLEETLKIIETLTHLRCRQIDKHYVIIHK